MAGQSGERAVTVGSSPAGGGETAKDPSGWSTDTLKAYVERIVHESDRRYEQRFEAQEKAVRAALDAAALAVERAEQNAEKWRANANEWRAAMTDREKKFMAQETADARFLDIDRRLADLSTSRDTAAGGKTNTTQLIAWAFGLAGIAIAAISLITR